MALGRTRKELLATIEPSELKEWMAFDRIEPFGAPAQDMQNAMVCYLLATGLLNAKRPFKFDEFQLIKEQIEKKEMDWRAIQAVFKKIAGYKEPKKK